MLKRLSLLGLVHRQLIRVEPEMRIVLTYTCSHYCQGQYGPNTNSLPGLYTPIHVRYIVAW